MAEPVPCVCLDKDGVPEAACGRCQGAGVLVPPSKAALLKLAPDLLLFLDGPLREAFPKLGLTVEARETGLRVEWNDLQLSATEQLQAARQLGMLFVQACDHLQVPATTSIAIGRARPNLQVN